mgnify:CR=1 FL=1
MQLGGNARARTFFKKHNIAEMKALPKYSSPFAIQYKNMIAAEVAKAYVAILTSIVILILFIDWVQVKQVISQKFTFLKNITLALTILRLLLQ